MWVVDAGEDNITEFSFGTAWDIRTLKREQEISISGQVSIARGIFFRRTDGKKMYILNDNEINEYDLTVGWDISTATHLRVKDTSGDFTGGNGIFFEDDGTHLFCVETTNDIVIQYTLTTAWDISSITSFTTFGISGQTLFPQDVFFKSDGTVMYVIDGQNEDIVMYELSAAWDITSAGFTTGDRFALPVLPFTTAAFGRVKSDGLTIFAGGNGADACGQWDLSVAYDIASIVTANGDGYLAGYVPLQGHGLFMHPDGTSFYVLNETADRVMKYPLSTPFDLSSVDPNDYTTFYLGNEGRQPKDVFIGDGGSKMYILDDDNNQVNQYALSTNYDITTASFTAALSISGQETLGRGLYLSPDGDKLFVIGEQADEINQYTLSTPWTITSATFNKLFDCTTEEAQPMGVWICDDGLKMFIVGVNGDEINQYDISPAFDLGTVTPTKVFSVSSQDNNPRGLSFSLNGKKMYVQGDTGNDINEYDLTS